MLVHYGVQLSQKFCAPLPGICLYFQNIFNLVIFEVGYHSSACSFLVSSLFDIFVRHNFDVPGQRKTKEVDLHFIKMVLMQCFLFGPTTTAHASIAAYTSLRTVSTDNPVIKATRNFLDQAFSYLVLTGFCMSFYFFTLSSPLFRHEKALPMLFRIQSHSKTLTYLFANF